MNLFKNLHILVFYGIDGSGKSTLVNCLANELRLLSYRTKIIRVRSHHTLMYIVIRLILGFKHVNYKSLQDKPLHLNYMIMNYFKSKTIYTILEIISVIIWFMLRLFPLIIYFRGDKDLIIADRYTPDFAVFLAYTADIKNLNMVRLVFFLEKFQILKPTYFYVYADPSLARARKMEEHLTKSFCSITDSKYQYISRYLNPIIINTSYSKPREIIPLILKELEKRNIIKEIKKRYV